MQQPTAFELTMGLSLATVVMNPASVTEREEEVWIAAVLDLSWVHSELAPYYPRIGRPSIDPGLMIRMLIIGYVFAICSERAGTERESVTAITIWSTWHSVEW
jgi:hypothetical protein